MPDTSAGAYSHPGPPPRWVARWSSLAEVWDNPLFQMLYSRGQLKPWLGFRWSLLAGFLTPVAIIAASTIANGPQRLGYSDLIWSAVIPATVATALTFLRLLSFTIVEIGTRLRKDIASGSLDSVFATPISSAEIQRGLAYSTPARALAPLKELLLIVLGLMLGFLAAGLVLGLETPLRSLAGIVILGFFALGAATTLVAAMTSGALAFSANPNSPFMSHLVILFVHALGAIIATLWYAVCVSCLDLLFIAAPLSHQPWAPELRWYPFYFFVYLAFIGVMAILSPLTDPGKSFERLRRTGRYEPENADSLAILEQQELARTVEEVAQWELAGLLGPDAKKHSGPDQESGNAP